MYLRLRQFRYVLLAVALSACTTSVTYDPYPVHSHCHPGDRRCHKLRPMPYPGHPARPPAHVQVWHQPGPPARPLVVQRQDRQAPPPFAQRQERPGPGPGAERRLRRDPPQRPAEMRELRDRRDDRSAPQTRREREHARPQPSHERPETGEQRPDRRESGAGGGRPPRPVF